MKILFILKYREVSDDVCGVYSYSGMSSGLFNSARMVSDMLNKQGVGNRRCISKLVQVIDNNCIDKEVVNFTPDVVILEALWVVPEKFEVLTKLHPNVKWIIRNHSNIPFLAQEGIAMEWVKKYIEYPNVYIGTNTKASLSDLKTVVADILYLPPIYFKKIVYFPNYYIDNTVIPEKPTEESHVLNVGCFGAIRPLKNHLTQAIAAIEYASHAFKHLRFHINVGRQESGGSPVLHNLRGLFNGSYAELVEHSWTPHNEFARLISQMDVSMQVSFTETFNIVTADAVTMGVPVVVSSDVSWIPRRYHASPTSTKSIVSKMGYAINDAKGGYIGKWLHDKNIKGLNSYNNQSLVEITNTINTVMGIIGNEITY